MKPTRILCVGMSKTATTSLHEALQMLGFRSCHHAYKGRRGLDLVRQAEQEGKPLLHYMPGCEALSDMSLHRWYRRLAAEYPEALFILTERDPERRAASKLKHDARWNERHPELPPRRVDEARGNELVVEQVQLEAEIKEWFRGSDRLLVMNIPAGDGWEKLCPFLGVDVPDRPFPERNRASLTGRVLWKIKELVHGILKLRA